MPTLSVCYSDMHFHIRGVDADTYTVNAGWKKPQIIVTLVLSVVFIVAFFFIERVVEDPAVPPRTWTNKNFLPLFIYAWSVYWFVFGLQIQLVQIFQVWDFRLHILISANIDPLSLPFSGSLRMESPLVSCTHSSTWYVFPIHPPVLPNQLVVLSRHCFGNNCVYHGCLRPIYPKANLACRRTGAHGDWLCALRPRGPAREILAIPGPWNDHWCHRFGVRLCGS